MVRRAVLDEELGDGSRRPGDDQRIAGGGRGSVVSLKRLFQNQLVQGQIGHRLPETTILLLKFLQAFGLVGPEATKLLTPAVVALLRHAERTAHLADRLTLAQGNLGLAKHADDLFWGVTFTAHFVLLSRLQNAPISINKPGPLSGGYSTTGFPSPLA